MPEVPRAVPLISVNPAGLITATTGQSEGYVSSGTESETQQLSTDSGQTVTPSTESQTAVTAGKYMTGSVVVDGDEKLLPENIKSGVSIFGVEGSYAPAVEQATPSIDVGDDGLITASATQSAGYVSGGTKSATKQLDVKDDSDLTVSDGTVTAPAGYYPSPVSKAVPEVVQATPSIDVSSEGLITASATQSAGYVASGTKSTTKQLEVKDDSDLTVSGGTVTAPAGYYPVSASKTISTVTQATPSITVDTTGLITAFATQSAGYVASGTKSATKQLMTQGAKVVKPSTSTQTAVASGSYTTGDVTVQGDSNLRASNIKDGISIFGVEGTYTGPGLPSLSTPGTAADLRSGKQLINQSGSIVTGTMSTVTVATPTASISTSGIITASVTQEAGYVAGGTKSKTYQIDTQSTKTITPTTSTQVAVQAYRYTTGSVYVEGDTNLRAYNIKKGISIFDVAGTYQGQEIYRETLTNASTPVTGVISAGVGVWNINFTLPKKSFRTIATFLGCCGVLRLGGTSKMKSSSGSWQTYSLNDPASSYPGFYMLLNFGYLYLYGNVKRSKLPVSGITLSNYTLTIKLSSYEDESTSDNTFFPTLTRAELSDFEILYLYD